VSSVTEMNTIFWAASSFDQNLGGWNLNSSLSVIGLGGTGLSAANYGATLAGWANASNTPQGLTLEATGLEYDCDGEASRQTLIDDYSWTINYDIEACNPFITTWQVSSDDSDLSITIPTTGSGYNYTVNWGEDSDGDGDMDIDTGVTGSATHTYTTEGEKTVSITGDFPSIYFNNGNDKEKILSVEQWGDIEWLSMNGAFYGCTELDIVASDAPNLDAVTDMTRMFRDASSLTGEDTDFNSWDVSKVTNMLSVFQGASSFNQYIGDWNTSNVTNMIAMFYENMLFNQDISGWNTSEVMTMLSMFNGASAFNQYLGSWNVSNVTNMSSMFQGATKFNGNIDEWGDDTRLVENMSFMFNGASDFNQDLGSWNVSKVENMNGMFLNAGIFNQDIGSWDVGSVTDMYNMFAGATSFNGNIDEWGDDTRLVENISFMFNGAEKFNQDIGSWNVSSVTNMGAMFLGATSFDGNIGEWGDDTGLVENMSWMFSGVSDFDQNISSWNVEKVETMDFMFSGASSFDQDIGGWNVEQVKSMRGMFANLIETNDEDGDGKYDVNVVAPEESSFNQDLSGWTVNQVTDMYAMFYEANAFDQNLGSWNLSSVTDMNSIFTNTSMDCENYSGTLIGWADNTDTQQTIDLGYVGSENSVRVYSPDARSARQTLIDDLGWTISGDALGTTNCTLTVKWTGATDTDWDTTTNWDVGIVPTITTDVIIPNGLTNYPTATNAVTANTIALKDGASFIPKSTVTGSVTYTRDLPTNNWYLISSPFTEATFDDLITHNTLATGTDNNIGLSDYDNDIGSWFYGTTNVSGTMSNGKGYAIKLETAGEFSLTGTITSADVTKSILTGSANNFYLIGNPYTAYINSDTFFSTNTTALSEETIWLWNGSAYVTYNAANSIEIAPMQGFFISAASNTNVEFNTSNQSHQTIGTFLRQEPTPTFEVSINNGDAQASTKVFYIADKTTGFDNGYDSKMFDGLSYDLAVFTELVTENQGNKLAIQTVPDYSNIIPLGVIAKAGEEITFSVESLNVPEDIKVYLEDKVNGEFVNLSETAYKTTFTNDSSTVGQFYISTTSKSLSTETINENNSTIRIYKSSNQEITITGLHTNATISVFSLLGKKVIDTTINANEVSTISLPRLSAGVYIVRLHSQYGEVTKKITLD
jgi:surface protein